MENSIRQRKEIYGILCLVNVEWDSSGGSLSLSVVCFRLKISLNPTVRPLSGLKSSGGTSGPHRDRQVDAIT